MIRKLKMSDISQLAELYFQFWGERSDISRMQAEFDKIQKEDRHIILVYEQQGKVIGSVMGVVCREMYGDCRPFIVVENMIIDLNSRRQGIGSALLKALEEEAEKQNCTQMILVTETERVDACAFYEKTDFQKILSATKSE